MSKRVALALVCLVAIGSMGQSCTDWVSITGPAEVITSAQTVTLEARPADWIDPSQYPLRKIEFYRAGELVCADLSAISVYARVDNWAYRLIKSLTPGPYTFVLPATRQLPKMLQNPKRRTIGIRVPDHRLVTAMLEALGEPIMSSTLSLPGDELPLTDPIEIDERIGNQIEVIIDCGPTGLEPTSVLDLSNGTVEILREGRGDISQFT